MTFPLWCILKIHIQNMENKNMKQIKGIGIELSMYQNVTNFMFSLPNMDTFRHLNRFTANRYFYRHHIYAFLSHIDFLLQYSVFIIDIDCVCFCLLV